MPDSSKSVAGFANDGFPVTDKNFDAAMRKILYYKQTKVPAKFTICTDNAGKVSVAKVELDCSAV
jgi:hypothetical protein